MLHLKIFWKHRLPRCHFLHFEIKVRGNFILNNLIDFKSHSESLGSLVPLTFLMIIFAFKGNVILKNTFRCWNFWLGDDQNDIQNHTTPHINANLLQGQGKYYLYLRKLTKEKKTEWKWEARKRSLKTERLRGFQPLFEISAVMWSIKYVVT